MVIPVAFWLLIAAIGGACAGSLITLLSWRIPLMMGRIPCRQFNLLYPRSHCPQCQVPLRLWHLIPVLSWLILRGRCAYCGGAIPRQLLAAELLSLILAVFLAWFIRDPIQLLLAGVFSGLLLTLGFIDLRHRLLPDMLTLPLLWLGLAGVCWPSVSGLTLHPGQAIAGAILGYLILWGSGWVFYWCTGKEGLGYGDAKLLAALGAWLGATMLPLVLGCATLLALAGAAAGYLAGYRQREIPFGPALGLSGWGWWISQYIVL